jgi:hypothetical protein
MALTRGDAVGLNRESWLQQMMLVGEGHQSRHAGVTRR